jgi:hypothetical protein
MAPVEEFLTSWRSGALSNPPLAAGGLILAYLVGIAVYRLYLSPLASFPGPKIAGMLCLVSIRPMFLVFTIVTFISLWQLTHFDSLDFLVCMLL